MNNSSLTEQIFFSADYTQMPLVCTLSSFAMNCPQGIVFVTSARLKLLVGEVSQSVLTHLVPSAC